MLQYNADMADHKARDADDGWQPATSRPGELYTYEGQIRSVGYFFRALRNKDPRQRAYRRAMQRVAALIIAITAGFVIVVIVVQALF